MNKTGIPYLDYTWNPCGFGCSKGCDGCWAARMALRIGTIIGCDDCKNYRVHFHPERLDQPSKKKDASVIGVQFTGELFDPKRKRTQIRDVIHACAGTSRHDYVFLTQQPDVMAGVMSECGSLHPNWYKGLTIKTQADADRDFPVFFAGPLVPRWLSVEPQHGPINLWRGYGQGVGALPLDDLVGVVVGCDNRASIPFELDWARSIVEQCKDADVPVYVKQLRIDGKLVHDPKDFPKDLRLRQLPWKLRTKKP